MMCHSKTTTTKYSNAMAFRGNEKNTDFQPQKNRKGEKAEKKRQFLVEMVSSWFGLGCDQFCAALRQFWWGPSERLGPGIEGKSRIRCFTDKRLEGSRSKVCEFRAGNSALKMPSLREGDPEFRRLVGDAEDLERHRIGAQHTPRERWGRHRVWSAPSPEKENKHTSIYIWGYLVVFIGVFKARQQKNGSTKQYMYRYTLVCRELFRKIWVEKYGLKIWGQNGLRSREGTTKKSRAKRY